MATHTAVFTFNNDNSISVTNDLPNVNKGDTINFQLVNSSGKSLSNWGLYFNNPFSLEAEFNYSFGVSNNEPQQGTLTIAQDSGANSVPKFSAYLVYVESEGTIYTKDPEVIVNNGDVEN